MKKLIFLFMGFFCFANSQVDSARIVQKLNELERSNAEAKMIIKKLDKIDRENNTLIYRIKVYIQKLTQRTHTAESEKVQSQLNNTQGIKAQNINEPVTDASLPDGFDSIKQSFFYRIFHREKILLKPYKIVNNEKVYLD